MIQLYGSLLSDRRACTGERGRVCVSFRGCGSPGIIHKGRAVGWQQIKIML